MTTATSLWPDDLVADSIPSTPAGILRDQTSQLESKTKGELSAEVHRDDRGEREFSYSFDLFAPRMRYRYSLLDLVHGPEQYPAVLYVDDRVGQELGWDTGANPAGRPRKKVDGDEELMEALRAIFGSKFTKRIVQGLLAQSVDAQREERDREDTLVPL